VLDPHAFSAVNLPSAPPSNEPEKTMDLSAFGRALPASLPGGAPPSAPDAGGGDTLYWSLPEEPSPPGRPFHRVAPVQHSSAPRPQPPAARAATPPPETEDLSEVAKRLPQAALPFQQRSSLGDPRLAPGLPVPVKTPLAPPAPSTGTEDLTELAKRLPRAATPFEERSPAPPSAPPPLSPISTASPSMPSAQPLPSPLPPSSPSLSSGEEWPDGLGDQFLAAMGEKP
jgi:hypothetical protein